MTDKTFYQAAAAEVADGVIDSALWIKVGAEMPGADNVARQAKYIQLRVADSTTKCTTVEGSAKNLFWRTEV